MASPTPPAPPASAGSGATPPASELTIDRAFATKATLLDRLRVRRRESEERAQRHADLNRALADPALSDAERGRRRAEFEARERDLLREARRRYAASDFEPLVIIGRGAYGEVKLVRAREDGAVYAMKTLRKAAAMNVKNAVAQVRAERNALAASASANPWVVQLHFSFQDDEHLYLVMDFCPGGDLMSLLIKEDTLPEDVVRVYAAEAAMALASVHALGYIHRCAAGRAGGWGAAAVRLAPP